jgi:chemotaxis protein methyltransferase CheR
MIPRFTDWQPSLSIEEFSQLADLIRDRAGLRFEEGSMFLFERRLRERLEALGIPDYGAYYKYLRFNAFGGDELDEAIERLTTKETYFFRQEYQLRAFRDQILPRLARANAGRMRLTLWSAGCSTGEETYSIAIIVDQSGLFDGWDVRVIGSDISRHSVACARQGVYRPTSFRVTPQEIQSRYFDAVPDGSAVIERIRNMCHFGRLNLLDSSRAGMVGRVDVIFCRNVLIYFDLESRRRVIDGFYERLLPGGFLLLGHSESLLNVTTAFELVHLREDLVYRKPSGYERGSERSSP